jgi:uncharacterized protein YndB with AHSA1/START domain
MADNKNLMITRVFESPLDKVWKAWTNPQELQKWWGPHGVTNPTCKWEAKPGGEINIVMLAGPELGELAGAEWPMTGQFTEVSPQERLVYTSNPIMDGKPIMESLTTVTFEEQDGKTKMTLQIVITQATSEAEGPLAGMEMGWNQSLDKLAENLEGSI